MLAVTCLVGITGLLAAACSSSDSGTSGGGAGGGRYVLGLDGSLSGSFGPDGVPPVDGVKAAINVANAAGGINGHKVSLIVKDDASTPTSAVANVRDFANQHASAMLGFTSSAPTSAAAPLAEQLQIPLLGTTLATTLLNPPQKWVFTSDADEGDYAAAQVAVVKQLVSDGKLPANPRVALMSFATPAGQTWEKVAKPIVQSDGFNLVADISTLPTATNYGAQATQLRSAKPDVIIDIINQGAITALTHAMKSAGASTDTYIIGFVSTTALGFMKSLDWPNFLSISPYHFPLASQDQDLANARTQAQAFKTDPDQALYLNGYAQGLIAIDALKRCGYPCSGPAMRDALEKTNLSSGLTFGPLALSSTQHAAVTTVGFLQPDAAGSAQQVGESIKFSSLQ